jgi:hypothetical protein
VKEKRQIMASLQTNQYKHLHLPNRIMKEDEKTMRKKIRKEMKVRSERGMKKVKK